MSTENKKDWEGKIDRWIAENREGFLRDLDRLIAIRSVSVQDGSGYPYGEGCAKVLEEALSLSREYGFETVNHDNYCGCAFLRSGKDAAKQIGLISHMDVVPEGEGWTMPPFRCTLNDGWVGGRGCRDDKGPGVMALYAMRFFQESQISLNNDLMLYFGCSEETGMEDIAHFLERQGAPDFSLVPDSNFPVCYGEKGILRFTVSMAVGDRLVHLESGETLNAVPGKARAILAGDSADRAERALAGRDDVALERVEGGIQITAQGMASHAAYPEGAVNALQVLGRAMLDAGLLSGEDARGVEKLCALTADHYGEGCGIACEDADSGKLTCVGSVSEIAGGRMRVQFDCRYPVTADGGSIVERLQQRMGEVGCDLEGTLDDKPNYIAPDHPAVTRLCAIASQAFGEEMKPYTMGGGTYARKLPNAVVFGTDLADEQTPFPPGHGGAHQPDESVRLELLEKGMKIYILSILELDGIV